MRIFVVRLVLLSLLLLGFGCAHDQLVQQPLPQGKILVDVKTNLERLIEQEDTDRDKRITVEDTRVKEANQGIKQFWLLGKDKNRYEVSGTYYLSNLLQELKLADDKDQRSTLVDYTKVFEPPVARLSRTIRDIFWDGLTRRLDGENIAQLLIDEKMTSSGYRYIYVPYTDAETLNYFSTVSKQKPELKLRVERLPARVTPEYVRHLDGKHGLLSLGLRRSPGGEYEGVPFVVPGGRFNEMYGWDSYFETLGLLHDGRIDLAKAMVDNFVYQITHYGKILNANRTYYLTRSQPPFFTTMILEVYKHLPRDQSSKAWLKETVHAAIREYTTVWMSEQRLTRTGLSRYYGSGIGPPPEVEKGHFDSIYRPFAQRRGLEVRQFEHQYKSNEITEPELDTFFIHDRCVRESGHDTTYRWNSDGDRCADFVTVDLNSLLYKMELDIARMIDTEFMGVFTMPDGTTEVSTVWYDRAKRRKNLILEYLWDDDRGLFFDYDLKNKKRHDYVSATTFYPLWTWNPEEPNTQLLSKERAVRLLNTALPLLEAPGGITGSSKESRGPLSTGRPARQWDYPNGWAPHQIMLWQGLIKYGFEEIAHRLIYRWLYTITRNAVDYNGTVPEKYDVVNRSHQVFAEYGNVGTRFSYITREGFGWMNASYQVGLGLLPPKLIEQLNLLIPPEWLFSA